MASIAIVVEHEEGHLLPTFKLAERLLARGHRVHYACLADAADLITRRGFAFLPILQDAFPPGSIRTLRAITQAGDDAAREAVTGADAVGIPYEGYLSAFIRGRDVEEMYRAAQPDLFLMSSFRPLHALVLHYRFQVPLVLLTPYLRLHRKAEYAPLIEGSILDLRSGLDDLFGLVQRADPRVRRIGDVSRRFLAFRELILCPAELDLPRPELQAEREVFYVEASVDLARRSESRFPWERLDPGRRLVYASVGSQSHFGGKEKVERFLRAVLDAFAGRAGWQLALSTGGLVRPEELPGAAAANVIAAPWLPQLSLLERAAVMITHGGLGTVKECIFNAVPMVVCPIAHDQPDNARRIEHHGLGLRGDFAGSTAAEIFALVDRVDREPAFRANVERMRRRFVEVEESGLGVQKIEEVLARRARPAA